MSEITSAQGVTLMQPPIAPAGHQLWNRAITVASIVVILLTLNEVAVLLGHYWLLESMGFASVFWTNFRMGALLYVIALVSFVAAAWIPAFVHPLRTRGWILPPGVLLATVAAYFLCLHYADFLFGTQPIGFDQVDPVFGHDLGFYVFDLPYIWIIWKFSLACVAVFLTFSVVSAFASRARDDGAAGLSRLTAFLGTLATVPVRIGVLAVGLVAAAGVWFQRYNLLTWDNSDSSVHVGADVLDVTGLFSNLHYIHVTAAVIVGITVALVLQLGQLARAVKGRAEPKWGRMLGVAIALIALDFAFKVAVELRDEVAIKPNEPVVQLEYIDRHIEATRQAFGLEEIEVVEFLPNRSEAPLPNWADLVSHPTVQNAPLWPGFASYLERLLDPQHADRILKTDGDPMVYGPTLDIFQQEQKLRTYYRFLGVDNVRYTLDGEKRILVSGVRELPLFEPVPWLNFWGQRYMLFTHGFGLAMAGASEVSPAGGPQFVAYDIPGRANFPQLKPTNERIYYGEGKETMAFSNVQGLKELDYPTEQDRAEIFLPPEIESGVYVDSLLKRLVFGWLSGRVSDFVFSELITDTTRVHYIRTPLARLEQLVPFLYLDSNPYAVVADGEVQWLVNGVSTSDRFPYSRRAELGDKSDERALFPRRTRHVNYVEDSVKATVNALDGRIRVYRISDAPVIRTWESVYPELFAEAEEMPEGIKRQLTYPTQLFHAQFDDLYIYYHMADPLYFFNLEDMWDDGDEVLGPVLASGKAITFSIEPYPLLLPTGDLFPRSSEPLQYAQVMIFTPEKALNLRAIPVVYQDWPDYGRKVVLQVPKGTYVMGPEQADAIIDQEPSISQKLSWWNRQGMEVIRGHTIVLPVGNEILYAEPIFLRSQQNPVTQMKKVAVVFRQRVALGDTLADAIREVLAVHRAEQSDARPNHAVQADGPRAGAAGTNSAAAGGAPW